MGSRASGTRQVSSRTQPWRRRTTSTSGTVAFWSEEARVLKRAPSLMKAKRLVAPVLGRRRVNAPRRQLLPRRGWLSTAGTGELSEVSSPRLSLTRGSFGRGRGLRTPHPTRHLRDGMADDAVVGLPRSEDIWFLQGHEEADPRSGQVDASRRLALRRTDLVTQRFASR